MVRSLKVQVANFKKTKTDREIETEEKEGKIRKSWKSSSGVEMTAIKGCDTLNCSAIIQLLLNAYSSG